MKKQSAHKKHQIKIISNTSAIEKAKTLYINGMVKDHNYESNSYLIGVDNHASYSMTNDMVDYVEPT